MCTSDPIRVENLHLLCLLAGSRHWRPLLQSMIVDGCTLAYSSTIVDAYCDFSYQRQGRLCTSPQPRSDLSCEGATYLRASRSFAFRGEVGESSLPTLSSSRRQRRGYAVRRRRCRATVGCLDARTGPATRKTPRRNAT